mmetsp:Transcript_20176/g.80537  ORF Transcript_20176/g.80537 Transcript_20176/m.80537 type:complete len:280 (-) Transcript_20176:6-845(-)
MVVSRHETIEIRVDGALRWTHREAHGGEPQALEYHIGASPRSAIRGEFAATGPRAILELRRSDESRSSSRSGGRRALEHVHEVRIDLPALDVERRTDRANLRAAPGIQLADDAPRRGPHVAVVPARRGRRCGARSYECRLALPRSGVVLPVQEILVAHGTRRRALSVVVSEGEPAVEPARVDDAPLFGERAGRVVLALLLALRRAGIERLRRTIGEDARSGRLRHFGLQNEPQFVPPVPRVDAAAQDAEVVVVALPRDGLQIGRTGHHRSEGGCPFSLS